MKWEGLTARLSTSGHGCDNSAQQLQPSSIAVASLPTCRGTLSESFTFFQ
eukprot:m.120259 g.120259  ORF g.120259 m.120259 type:complete len:50 (+) comp37730_c0_seq27:1016-1165(+)